MLQEMFVVLGSDLLPDKGTSTQKRCQEPSGAVQLDAQVPGDG